MKPIKIRVNTIWQGKVGVRDRYLAQARDEKKSIVITHKKEKMTLKFGTIRNQIVSRSENAFKDRFGNHSHYLYYFVWKPDGASAEQLRLDAQFAADVKWFDEEL